MSFQANESGELDFRNAILKRTIVSTVSYPFYMARTLIELGHEPVPGKIHATYFTKDILKMPNILDYVRYIYNTQGLVGCYRGFAFCLCRNFLGTYVASKLIQYRNDQMEFFDKEKESLSLWKILWNDLSYYLATSVLTYPFHVLTTRAIAEFAGSEVRYSGNFFAPFWIILRENGITGLYSGFTPHLLGDILTISFASFGMYAIREYWQINERKQLATRSAFLALMSYFTSTYNVVSNCMAINNVGIRLGYPPYSPIYANWIDCWDHLSRTNQLSRGRNMFWRLSPRITAPNSSVYRGSR